MADVAGGADVVGVRNVRLKPAFRDRLLDHFEEAATKGVSMPELYEQHVKKLKEKGYPSRIAWPIVVEQIALGCLTGETTLPKPGGTKREKQELSKGTRASWCKSYALYKSNHPKGTGYGKKRGRG